MNERLQELLTRERLTAMRFAELVDVQRSSVSHVLSGRNKPGLDFIGKILTAFPHVSPDWLILGQGGYKRQPGGLLQSAREEKVPERANFPGAGVPKEESMHPAREEAPAPYGQRALFDEKSLPDAPAAPAAPLDSAAITDQAAAASRLLPSESERGREKRVVKMVFFYADRTFEVYLPGEER